MVVLSVLFWKCYFNFKSGTWLTNFVKNIQKFYELNKIDSKKSFY